MELTYAQFKRYAGEMSKALGDDIDLEKVDLIMVKTLVASDTVDQMYDIRAMSDLGVLLSFVQSNLDDFEKEIDFWGEYLKAGERLSNVIERQMPPEILEEMENNPLVKLTKKLADSPELLLDKKTLEEHAEIITNIMGM